MKTYEKSMRHELSNFFLTFHFFIPPQELPTHTPEI